MAVDPLNDVLEVASTGSAPSTRRNRTQALDPRFAAELRVAEYLFALGLRDTERVSLLVAETLATVPAGTKDAAIAEEAIARLQERVDRFRLALFGEDEPSIDPIWMRTFVGAHPAVFLGDEESARARVRGFGDPRAGKPPVRRTFRDQSLDRLSLPDWLRGLLIPVGVTGMLTALVARELLTRSADPATFAFVGLYGFLTLLGTIGAATAIRGFFAREAPLELAPPADPLRVPRTALVMPIYHESPEHVFAAILAMRESLAALPGGDGVEVFVLSDSRDPERIAEEERAFRRTAALGDPRIPTYYRRRARNEHQKAGNLAEFFERFGYRYDYAVVLDADSVMHGETILELVRRMESNPKLGLLQTPLAAHGSTTVFARAHQLAASAYGPVFVRGLAAWAGPVGNYYGHNAILRVRAFLDCCALPRLRGEPPLGGNILSHDFVEAALLCRAGYEVRTATDLGGSYEELPQAIPEYVARDRRWCQGNLQHLRIALAEGLRTMSRIHMLVGASAYLAGPAWLGFIALSVVLSLRDGRPVLTPTVAILASAVAVVSLVVPRLLGLADTIRDPVRRRGHGGALRATVGVLIEMTVSTLLAPILLLHHARIVASILVGASVSWGAQARRASSPLGAIVRGEAMTTVLGLGLGALAWSHSPSLFLWLSPILVPWALAIPWVAFVSSDAIGRVVRRLGLFAVPTEVEPDELLVRADELRALTASDAAARFRDVVLDPVLLAAKLARLEDRSVDADVAALDRLVDKALRGGPASLTEAERARLSEDAPSLRRLHREAWRRWPVESWSQGRERPQLPPEPDRIASS